MSFISARRSPNIGVHASGQDTAMSVLAARYMRVMIPGLACAATNESLKRYLMAQNVVLPETLAMLSATALSPLFNHILVSAGLLVQGLDLTELPGQQMQFS